MLWRCVKFMGSFGFPFIYYLRRFVLKIKNIRTAVQLFAFWELIWLLAAVFGHYDASLSWLFPLAATLAGAPVVAVTVFFAATKLSALVNRKETKK